MVTAEGRSSWHAPSCFEFLIAMGTVGTKCELGATSRASSSSDNDSDYDSVTESSEVCIPIRDLPSTEKKRHVSYYGVHSAKESLLEELLALKDAFEDQKFHLTAHKGHHNAMEVENRQLEKKIEYLETFGLEAALTGTPAKLKSKLKACKARIVNLETICATNAAEERNLRMDTQFMKTQEVTVEREMFAREVRRLQRCVYHLGSLHKESCDDNKEAVRLKVAMATVTAKIPELETSLSSQRKSLEDMATKSAEWLAKGAAAKEACVRDYARFKSLQEESKSTMDALFKEKQAKAELTGDVNTLSHQVRMAQRELREKERNAALGIE